MSGCDIFIFGLLIFAFSKDGGFGELVGAIMMIIGALK